MWADHVIPEILRICSFANVKALLERRRLARRWTSSNARSQTVKQDGWVNSTSSHCQLMTYPSVPVPSGMYQPRESHGELGVPSLQGRRCSSQKAVSIRVETWTTLDKLWIILYTQRLYNITIYGILFPPQLVSPALEPLKKFPTPCHIFYSWHPLAVILTIPVFTISLDLGQSI